MNLEKRFFHYVTQNKLLRKKAKVLIGFSGGVDSVALALLMQSIAHTYELELRLVYVNHNVRTDSEKEEAFVRDFAKKYHLPLKVYQWEHTEKKSLEELARNFRYHAFKKEMENEGFDYLLTAHHADDLCETMWMRFIRGARLLNFATIFQSRKFSEGALVRPLLNFSKEELQNYVLEKEENYITDYTNEDMNYFRNRVRKTILPFIQKEQTNYVDLANSYVREFGYFKDVLEKVAKDYLNEHLTKEPEGFCIRNFKNCSRSEKFVILDYFFQKQFVAKIEIKKVQIEGILNLFEVQQAPLTIQLERNIHVTKKEKDLWVTY